MLGAWRTPPRTTLPRPRPDPAGEVVELCRELIRMDTSNYGDEDGPGGAEGGRVRRRPARRGRDRVASLRSRSPAGPSVVARWGGRREGDGLLLHGHLDVVPAAAEDWQVHPFSGEIQDGYVWGRGAVDMKDFDAMLLSVVRARQRAGRVPERPIVLCFTADEEARRAQGRPGHRRRPPRGARGRHRGRGRGRRLLDHGPWPADVPRRGGREGDGLDAADRPRPGRPRLDAEPRQRRVAPDRRRRPDRRLRVAGAADAHDGGPAGLGGRAGRRRGHPENAGR